MKNILNIGAFVLFLISVLFKANHLAGASIAIILSGLSMLLALLFYGIKENKKAGISDGLNYFIVAALSLFIVGIIFKFQDWPGADILAFVGYVFALIFPVILMIPKSNFRVSKQYMITFFTYFIILITIVSKNPLNTF